MPLAIPGPQGPQGIQGVQGPTGPQGPGSYKQAADMYYRQAGTPGIVQGPTTDRVYLAGAVTGASLGTGSQGISGAVLAPMYISGMNHITEVGFTTTAASSATVSIIVYSNTEDYNLYPYVKLFQTGPISAATPIGYKFEAVNLTLAPDQLYWFGIAFTASTTVRTVPAAACWPILGFDPAVSVASPGIGYSALVANHAWPEVFDQGRPVLTSASITYPAIAIKFG